MDNKFLLDSVTLIKNSVPVSHKMVELMVNVNELTFEINKKGLKMRKPISLFKKRKLKDTGVLLTLQGTNDSETIKFHFRSGDPNITVVAQCFNKMFESLEKSSKTPSQPIKLLPEHSSSRVNHRPCSLIRTDTFKSVCASENSSQASDYLKTKEAHELFPMKAMENQAAPLSLSPARSPLKSRNQTVSKLEQIRNCANESAHPSPSYSMPKNYKLQTTPKAYAPFSTKTPTPKSFTQVQSPKSRPPIYQAKRKTMLNYEEIMVVNSPKIQNRKQIEATPLPVLEKINSENSGSVEVDKFGYRKLINIGNSCYMNSTLQALSAIDQFTFRMRQVHRYLVFREDDIKKMTTEGQQKLELLKLTCQILYNLKATLSKPTRKSIPTEEKMLTDVRNTIGKTNPDFDNCLQQDAHEFLLVYCSQIETTIRKFARKVYKSDYGELPDENCDEFLLEHCEFRKMCPSDTFLFKTELKLICMNCGHSRIQNQGSQMDVNVTVRKNRNLQELVDESFPCNQNPDVICDVCAERGAKMSSRISKFPESLVVSLKRYKSFKNSTKKCDTLVPVTTILYTSRIAEFQDEIVEFSDDELDMDLDLRIDEEIVTVMTSPPKLTAIDDEKTLEKCEEEVLSPTRSLKRRSSSSNHVDLFCKKDLDSDDDVYFDCNTTLDDNRNLLSCSDQVLKQENEKLLGGSDVIKKSSPKTIERTDSDFEIVEEKVCSTITFAPLNDYQQVLEILEELDIRVDDKDAVRKHLETLPKEKVEVSITERPTTRSVKADGNCFYRCIALLLTAYEKYHDYFRTRNVKFIEKNAEKFASITIEKISDVVKKASNYSEWSSEVEIIAMCTLLKCDIYTFLEGRWVRYQPKWVDGEKRGASLYLANRGTVHFEPVVGLAKTSRGTKRTSTWLSKNDDDNDRNYEDDEVLPDDDEMPTSRPRLSRSCKNVASYSEERVAGRRCAAQRREENQKATRTKTRRVEDGIDWKTANGSPVYVLSSIVCHQGKSLNSGHYVAYTRNASTNEWVYCSDEIVYSVPENKALTDCAEKGYVFYYSKVMQ